MTYIVEVWDDVKKGIERHDVEDAIDFDDAEYVILERNPKAKILSIIHPVRPT